MGRSSRYQRWIYHSPTGTFGITTPINGEPATRGNGSTLGFTMQSPEQAEAFHAAGVANGGPRAKSPRDGATARWASSTWPICATPTATSSARYAQPCARAIAASC